MVPHLPCSFPNFSAKFHFGCSPVLSGGFRWFHAVRNRSETVRNVPILFSFVLVLDRFYAQFPPPHSLNHSSKSTTRTCLSFFPANGCNRDRTYSIKVIQSRFQTPSVKNEHRTDFVHFGYNIPAPMRVNLHEPRSRRRRIYKFAPGFNARNFSWDLISQRLTLNFQPSAMSQRAPKAVQKVQRPGHWLLPHPLPVTADAFAQDLLSSAGMLWRLRHENARKKEFQKTLQLRSEPGHEKIKIKINLAFEPQYAIC